MRKNVLKYGMIAASSMMLAMGVSPTTTYAQMNYETESNDTTANAVTMLPNVSYQGAMDSQKDIDFYKFTTTVDGYFNLNFKQSEMMEKINYGWDVTIYNENGDIIYYQKNTKNIKTYNFPFSKGHTFYICIKGTYDDNWCPVNSLYTLSIEETENKSYEREDNNTMNTANPIEVNQDYYGNMYVQSDEDYYSFIVPEQGYFTVSLEKKALEESINYGWNYYLYTQNGDCVYSSERITTSSVSYKFAYPKGTMLYLKVVPQYKDNWCPVGSEYKIKVNTVKSSVWESENNNTLSVADNIELNKTYYGNLQQNNDMDCYKFKVTQDGFFKLNFNLADLGNKVTYGYKITLYQNGKEFYSTNRVTGAFSTPDFSFKKGSTYYAKIEPDYKDNWCPRGIDYKFNVKFTASSNWEKEANNSTKTATSIKAETNYTGAIFNSNDMDYFAYVAGANEKLAIKFGKKSMDNNVSYGWDVQVYVNNKSKISERNIKDLSKSLGKVTVKKGDKVVIKVTPTYKDNWAPLHVQYSLKLSKAK